MDIWAWVRSTKRELRANGNARLAELMDKLPTAVCDNEHARADAIYPEALALARDAKHKWAEIFVRHWNLQGRILHRHDVGDWTGEAIDLLDFANQEDTRDCPQSICVTQDVVNAYGQVDGPGFAQERLDATAETLARIDAKWPCFTCISAERCDALRDAGRLEDALVFIEAQTEAMVAAGAERATTALAEDKADCLIALGRHEEALWLMDNGLGPAMDRNAEQERAIDRGRALVRLERYDEAREGLPPYKEIIDTPSLYMDWVDVVLHLVRANKIVNDWQLDASLETMNARLVEQGVRRNAIELFFERADLALRRGMPHVARELVERAEALFDDLNRLLDVRGTAVALRGRLNVADPVAFELPDSPDALQPGSDPERATPMLEAALRRWPQAGAIVSMLADAYRVRRRRSAGERLLQAWLGDNDDAQMLVQLGNTLLEAGAYARVIELATEQLSKTPSDQVTAQCHWLLARAYQSTQPQLCRQHLEKVAALEPEATHCHMWLAELERDAGEWAAALERLNGICAREPEAGSYDWDRLIVATLLEDWPAARDSARRIGYVLDDDDDTPIVLPGILCRIQYESAEGETQVYYARRSGPVTADIIQIRDEPTSRYRDRIVFDAAPLNDGPKDGDENHTWLYRMVHVIEPGGYTIHPLDGVHPGDETVAALRAGLEEAGCETQVFSGESYQLEHPETGERTLGLYMMCAQPKGVDVKALDALLAELTRAWPTPLTWMSIAEAAGNEVRSAAQLKVQTEWGM
jgi:tetratricopeptide (TPR) repeat protein